MPDDDEIPSEGEEGVDRIPPQRIPENVSITSEEKKGKDRIQPQSIPDDQIIPP